MKKLFYLIILVLILGLVLTGCFLSNIGQVPTTEQKYNENNPNPNEFVLGDLVAGQNIKVGTVTVSNDADYLYVKYHITDLDWCLTETHLHVATSLEDIPQKNGNPTPGKFDYKGKHDCVTEYTYEILLDSDWEPCTELFIAAHAVVVRPVDECVEEVWIIGDEETGQLTNYCDELNLPNNWPSETALYPDFPDPFVVGTNDGNEFPWISNKANDYATDFKVHWSGELLFGGELIVSWSPGKSATETKIITIIDDLLTSTFVASGGTDINGWQGYPLVTSNIELDPVGYADIHQIRFQHTTGDGALWDWIKLEKPCEQWETAWGDGQGFPGKNWATYFTYTIPCPDPVLVNGGFENPTVTDGWAVFISVPGWTIENYDDENAEYDPQLEIQKNVKGWTIHDGQYAELDSYDPTCISQEINTCLCKNYTITFWYSPRPGVSNNHLIVYWDGDVLWDTGEVDGSGLSDTDWQKKEISPVAPNLLSTSTWLKFCEVGPDDQLGMFIDDISIEFATTP